MNDEKKRQLLIFIKLFVIIICAGLYAWGGMEHKFLRRFVAPSVAGVTIFAFSGDWKSLIKVPILMFASIMGYGGDEFWVKFLKRLKVGITFGIGACSYEILKTIRGNKAERKLWAFCGWCIFTITSAYILLGAINPFGYLAAEARVEETILGLTVYSMAILPVGRKR